MTMNDNDFNIDVSHVRGECGLADFKLAKELLVKGWKDRRDDKDGRHRFVWGLIYIGYTFEYAGMENLDEELENELAEEEELWLEDDGCPGESFPDYGPDWDQIIAQPALTDAELEAYLESRRK